MTLKLLIINPNSSEKVTSDLEESITPPPGLSLHFYTAPADAPKEITGTETSVKSGQVVLENLQERDLLRGFDGFLVCCYSDHPLVHSISTLTDKPILGIMQATLLYSLLRPSPRKLFVLTSGSGWNPLLDQAIVDFFGCGTFPQTRFQKTQALDIEILSLNDKANFEAVTNKVRDLLEVEYGADDIGCVLLGCAGMAGLDAKLTEVFPQVEFIDSVKIGVELLAGLARFQSNKELSLTSKV